MKLIMPMAGLGSRFKEQVKPLIDVNGVPMFVHSERCIGIILKNVSLLPA